MTLFSVLVIFHLSNSGFFFAWEARGIVATFEKKYDLLKNGI